MRQIDMMVNEQLLKIITASRKLDELQREGMTEGMYEALIQIKAASGRALNVMAKVWE